MQHEEREDYIHRELHQHRWLCEHIASSHSPTTLASRMCKPLTVCGVIDATCIVVKRRLEKHSTVAEAVATAMLLPT